MQCIWCTLPSKRMQPLACTEVMGPSNPDGSLRLASAMGVASLACDAVGTPWVVRKMSNDVLGELFFCHAFGAAQDLYLWLVAFPTHQITPHCILFLSLSQDPLLHSNLTTFMLSGVETRAR